MTARAALAPWLNALFGAAPAGELIEVRHMLQDRAGMGRAWFSVREPGVADYILKLGQRVDVYVGVAPRARREGGRDAIEHAHVLWADCDDAEALEKLRLFRPLPSMVVRSGSPDSVHAYWSCWPPATPDEAEQANRKLAHALAADPRSTDAARILRPPGALNWKHSPPTPVWLAHLAVEIFTVEQVVGELPEPPQPKRRERRDAPRAVPGEDPLLEIEPAEYVEALVGRPVPASGLMRCPLPDHFDRTPSFKVYESAEAGVWCFGCERGGSIYDFARELSGIGDRGAEFERLREWIAERLLNAPLEMAA